MRAYEVWNNFVSEGIPVQHSFQGYSMVMLGDGYSAYGIPISGAVIERGRVRDCGVLALEGTNPRSFRIVAPRNGDDNRVLVLWRVTPGCDAFPDILTNPAEGLKILAHNRTSLCERAHMVLAILEPGAKVEAFPLGLKTPWRKATLCYDGQKVVVTDTLEGDYL